MIKYLRILIASYYWARSLKFSRKEKYQEALTFFNKIQNNDFFINELYFSYRGFLYTATENKEEAIESFIKVIEYSNTSRSSLNIDEKVYIKNYVSVLSSYLGVLEEPFGISDDFDIKKVSKYMLDTFPYEKEWARATKSFEEYEILKQKTK